MVIIRFIKAASGSVAPFSKRRPVFFLLIPCRIHKQHKDPCLFHVCAGFFRDSSGCFASLREALLSLRLLNNNQVPLQIFYMQMMTG